MAPLLFRIYYLVVLGGMAVRAACPTAISVLEMLVPSIMKFQVGSLFDLGSEILLAHMAVIGTKDTKTRAMIDHNYVYATESEIDSAGANPRLDSANGWENDWWFTPSSATGDFWVETDFAGNTHFVHEAILERTTSGSDYTITDIKIKYQNSGVSGSTWLDHDSGNTIPTGMLDADAEGTQRTISFTTPF